MRKITTVVSIDQSFTRTGYAVVRAGELVEVGSVDLRKCANRVEKRVAIRILVVGEIGLWQPEMVIVERVRLFAGGRIAFGTILALGGLTATIIDEAYPIPVYSVDTRSWKAAVLGQASADKVDALEWLGRTSFVRDNPEKKLDHDAADAAAMGLYPWRARKVLLKREW